MFCTKCGSKLHDGDVFCAQCGTRVRKEETGQNESRYSDVVFNPPFKLEAQRRTEEISQGIKEYSSEPKRESVDFNWNLDGFPGNRLSRADEDFKFNWDDVIEKRNRNREVDLEKIVPAGATSVQEQKGAAGDSAETAENTDEIKKEELEKEDTEKGLSIEELERELFGEAPSQVSQDAERELEMTLRYRREDLDGAKDKFYTYNAKRDAFQELLDKEKAHIEKLEEARSAQWQSLTPAEEEPRAKEPPAFEDIFVEPKLFNENYLQEVGIAMPPKTAAVMADEETGERTEELAAAAALGAAAGVVGAAGTAGIAEAVTAESSSEKHAAGDSQDAAESRAEQTAESSAEKPAESAESAENEEKQNTEQEIKDGAETPPFQAESQPEDKTSETDETSETGETGEEHGNEDHENEEHKEKAKLRFSDVFPRDAVDIDSGAGDGSDATAGKEEKAAKGQPVDIGEDEDDDEEERRRPVLKFVIILLAILVAIEIIVIGIKFIAPESGFSQGVDKFINSIAGIFSGSDDEGTAEPEPAAEVTYITEYINASSAGAANIGSISENISLKYDSDKTYAFEEIQSAGQFQDEVWKTDDDGNDIYIGQQIIESLITYYMKDEETLAEGVVGINKLEIGEIKAGESGYYVLTKLTYAQEEGGETVKYESVHLTDSSDAITVKEVKEENL